MQVSTGVTNKNLGREVGSVLSLVENKFKQRQNVFIPIRE